MSRSAGDPKPLGALSWLCKILPAASTKSAPEWVTDSFWSTRSTNPSRCLARRILWASGPGVVNSHLEAFTGPSAPDPRLPWITPDPGQASDRRALPGPPRAPGSMVPAQARSMACVKIRVRENGPAQMGVRVDYSPITCGWRCEPAFVSDLAEREVWGARERETERGRGRGSLRD